MVESTNDNFQADIYKLTNSWKLSDIQFSVTHAWLKKEANIHT